MYVDVMYLIICVSVVNLNQLHHHFHIHNDDRVKIKQIETQPTHAGETIKTRTKIKPT